MFTRIEESRPFTGVASTRVASPHGGQLERCIVFPAAVLTLPYRTILRQVRYSRLLEEGDFRGRTGDFVWFLLFCAALMVGAAPFMNLNFLGRPLAFMMVYVWGRWVLSACT